MNKNFKNLLSPKVQCTSITNRVLSSIDRFTAFYNCMKKIFKNLITPYVKYTSITNRFLNSFDRFTVFTTVRGKTSKISLIRDFSAQVSPIVFSAHLTVLRLITTLWEKTLKNLISPWTQCTSIKKCVLSSHDRFTVFHNCMSKNFKNLKSPWVQCTSITNFILSSLDRFTVYYNCMR